MNKIIYPGVSILKVSDDIVNIFLKFIERRNRENNYDFIHANRFCTYNGNQTENLIHLIKDKTLEGQKFEEIKNTIKTHIFGKFEYHWIHAISYNDDGYQKRHTHDKNEECSFILYLNDCDDGHTNFYVNPKRNIQYKIKPEKGKLVVFSSSIPHDADKTTQNKKILVGGLRIEE